MSLVQPTAILVENSSTVKPLFGTSRIFTRHASFLLTGNELHLPLPFMNITVHTDGGSRGNPGPSAWGYTLERGDGAVDEHGGFLGCTTNNVAEYTALVQALRYLRSCAEEGDTILINSDSKLMVQQVNGLQVCAADHLVPLCIQAQAIMQVIRDMGAEITLKHVRRHLNVHADAVVNEILDKEEQIVG